MRPTVRILLALMALTSLAGCNLAMRRTLDNPGRNQVVRVESGERLYLHLEEVDGRQWTASCADSDILVKIDHVDGKAEVEVRVHRGYDGPSEVKLCYRRPGERTPAKEFTLALYRRTGDSSVWKK